MSTIKEAIDRDLRAAMLAKDEIKRDALRMVKSEILLKEVEVRGELDEAQLIAVLQRAIKTRRESIEQYLAGDRKDAAEREQAEIDVLSPYLPRTLGEDELRAALTAIVAELSLSGKKDLGRLMKEIKARHPSVDGKLASTIAGSLLA